MLLQHMLCTTETAHLHLLQCLLLNHTETQNLSVQADKTLVLLTNVFPCRMFPDKCYKILFLRERLQPNLLTTVSAAAIILKLISSSKSVKCRPQHGHYGTVICTAVT